jgi:hypothetical protein
LFPQAAALGVAVEDHARFSSPLMLADAARSTTVSMSVAAS